jgi:hypothetical protein
VENTANLGLFAVHKIVSEYAERLHAYTEKAGTEILMLLSKQSLELVTAFKAGSRNFINIFLRPCQPKNLKPFALVQKALI